MLTRFCARSESKALHSDIVCSAKTAESLSVAIGNAGTHELNVESVQEHHKNQESVSPLAALLRHASLEHRP
jgi:hypothetical protein